MTSEPAELARAADLLERLAAGAPRGEWRLAGLLATRPEVVAQRSEGSEHVAEARAASAGWIVAMQPALAPPLVGWLRRSAVGPAADPDALEFARALLRHDVSGRDRAPR